MNARSLPVVLFLATLLLACPSGDDDDSAVGPPIPDFIDVEVRLSDIATDDLLMGATLAFEDQQEDTDINGRARVTIPSQDPFELELSMGGYADHALAGLAGIDDFQYVARLIERNTLGAWLVELGLAPDTDQAVLVVALQTIALQAATDAAVTIDAASDPPFVLVGGDPQAGNELVFGADSLVIFPNVAPGAVNLSITPPEGDSCLAFPSLVATGDLTAYALTADVVTVVGYICQ